MQGEANVTEVVVGMQLLIGVLFATSGAAKCLHLRRFHRIVRSYELLPQSPAAVLSVLLPPLELLLGALLIGGWGSALAAAAAAFLLFSFAAAIAVNVHRRNFIECGCGGVWTPPEGVSWQVIARDSAIAVLACVVAFDAPPSLPQLLRDGVITTSSFVAICITTTLLFIGLRLAEELVQLMRLLRHTSAALTATPRQ